MADMIKFYKGALASLPANGAAGAIYVTEDEGGIYLGLGTGMKRLGDFIQVDAVANLPTAGANTSALYYCVAENILAKWNGSDWTQINSQKTLAQLGGVSQADYNTKIATLEAADTNNANAISDLGERVATAEGEIDDLQAAIGENGSVTVAIAAAKKAGDDAQADVDALSDYVGTIPEGYTESTVIAYINKKAEETLTSATGGSSESAASVKLALDTYKADNDAAVSAVDEKADAAQSAADAAQADVDALAAAVGEVAEGKTVVEMIEDAQVAATYDDTQVKADIATNAAAIDAIEADYLKAADKTELNNAIALKADATDVDAIDERVAAIEDDYLKAADKTELANADAAQVERIEVLEGQIVGLSGAMHFEGVKDSIPEDVSGYENGDVIIVGDKEYVFNSGAFVEFGDVSAEGERIAALEGAVDAIEADYLKAADKTELQGNIDAKVAQADYDAKVAELAQADTDNLAAAKKYTDDEIAALGIADYVKKVDADAAYAAIDHNHDEDYDAKGAAAQALVDAKAYADGKDSAMDTRVKALEAIDHEAYIAADEQVLSDAKAYADGKDAAIAAAKSAADKAQEEVDALEQTHAIDKAALEASIGANADAISLKANAADVYAKNETYTQDEVDALLTEALQWGSF